MPKLSQGMGVGCSLSQERGKKSLSLLSEDEDDWNMEYYFPSHTSGAMEIICILGAQEDKHRDGEKAKSTSLQRGHTPTALHSPALRTQPTALACSTTSCQQPFGQGKSLLQAQLW